MTSINIGILSFQGAFEEHKHSLENACLQFDSKFQLTVKNVKRPSDLTDLDGLILPGGESTTMSKFLEKNNFKGLLFDFAKGCNRKIPIIWGTCAGFILLANTVIGTKATGQITIGGIDVTMERNVYGRQNESFEATLMLKSAKLIEKDGKRVETYHGVFIRAPGILSVDSGQVQVLAELQISDHEGRPVAVRQDNLLATTFHPELTNDHRWHRYFLEMILDQKRCN